MLFARSDQIRHLTSLKNIDPWNVVKYVCSRMGTLVGLERQMYPELLNKVYRRVSLKICAVMITTGKQRVKEGKYSYLEKIFGEKIHKHRLLQLCASIACGVARSSAVTKVKSKSKFETLTLGVLLVDRKQRPLAENLMVCPM